MIHPFLVSLVIVKINRNKTITILNIIHMQTNTVIRPIHKRPLQSQKIMRKYMLWFVRQNQNLTHFLICTKTKRIFASIAALSSCLLHALNGPFCSNHVIDKKIIHIICHRKFAQQNKFISDKCSLSL